MIYIYGLRCPIANEIRYIGKSSNPRKRLKAHCGSAVRHEYDHHTARWLRKLIEDGFLPELVILEMVGAGADWRLAERGWIAKGDALGWHLTNSTLGGEGLDYRDPAAKAAYIRNLSAAMKSLWSRPERREEARLRAVALHADPIISARRSASLKMAFKDPEFRKRHSETCREIGRRPEVVEAKRKATADYWMDHRATRLSAMYADTSKANHAAGLRRAWADPEKRRRHAAQQRSAETRARKSISAHRRATPEYRAMMAEKTRLSWERRRLK